MCNSPVLNALRKKLRGQRNFLVSYFGLVAVATRKKEVDLENGDRLRKGAGFRRVESFRRVEVAMP